MKSFLLLVCLTILSGVIWVSNSLAKPRIHIKKWKLKILPKMSFRIPKDDISCFRYIRQHVKRKKTWAKRYPKTLSGAVTWIQYARKHNRMLTERGAILGKIQSVIDKPRRGRLHLLFGNNHSVIEHYRFFNELFHLGRDNIRLSGVTHLALEAFVSEPNARPFSRRMRRTLKRLWSGKGDRRRLLASPVVRAKMAQLVSSDQQRLIDLFVHKHEKWSYHLLEVISHFLLGSAYSPMVLHEMLATLRYARQYHQKLKVLATDMSLRMRGKTKHLACWLYSLREVFALHAVNRIALRRKSVIAYMWGSHHVRRDHFARFISRSEEVFSIRFQGGGKPDIWDRASLRLHLPMKMFAIYTPGAREADLMIHFPPVGSYHPMNRQIRSSSLSKLSRQPKRKNRRKPLRVKLFPSYRMIVATILRQMRHSLLRCYRRRNRSVRLRIRINGVGRISNISLVRSKRASGWSLACLQKCLWRMPMPIPPKHQAVEFVFRLHFSP